LTDETLAPPYRGRFAPTPSGPLHLGSLLTALAGWLQARRARGSWLLRIDDLDRPRCQPGADSVILRQLEAHGLAWDEPPRYQSAHIEEYEAALQRLHADGRIYPCTCTRALLAQHALPGPDGPVYDGRCRARRLPCSERHALRFRVEAGMVAFEDGWRATQRRNALSDVGDFVLRRSDGTMGYQLACAVDERAQGITEVVRGADLLGSTFRQRLLIQALHWRAPGYCHGPVLVARDGLKLSKQNHAAAVEPASASVNLVHCLGLLGCALPVDLQESAPAEILAWACAHWAPERLLQLACTSLELA